MVRSTLRSRRITQNAASRNGDYQNLLIFLVFDRFHPADLALELNPGSQYYEDSDAEVMVQFGSVGAEKWQSQNWKLAAMVHSNFGNVTIRSKSDTDTKNWNREFGKGNVKIIFGNSA